MKLFDVYPLNNIPITRAQGSQVWDEQGTKYLDLYGGHAVISIGHGHPHWKKRIEEQLSKISFYSNSIHIPLQEALAEKLGTVSGKEDYQLFYAIAEPKPTRTHSSWPVFIPGEKRSSPLVKPFTAEPRWR